MSESRMWGIHGGATGDAFNLFTQQNVIALGWDAIGNLSEIPNDQAEFRNAVIRAYPEKKAGAVPVDAGQLRRFVYELQTDDIVVFPAKLEMADDAREIHQAELEIRRIEQEGERRVAQTDLIAAQRELDRALANPAQAQRELEGALEEHDAEGAYRRVKQRIDESPVRVYEAEILDWQEQAPDTEPEADDE